MNIEDYADILNIDLIIRRYHNQQNRYMAEFENTEIKGDGVLISAFGNGTSPLQAVGSFVEQIRGKNIVINAGQNNRREYSVPTNLTY